MVDKQQVVRQYPKKIQKFNAWLMCIDLVMFSMLHVAVLIPQDSKANKSKQSSFSQDLTSLLVYEPMEGNTGIVIFMPTSKCLLAVAASHFSLLLIVHLMFKLSNGAK